MSESVTSNAAVSTQPVGGRRRTTVVSMASAVLLSLSLIAPGSVAAEPLVATVVAPPNATTTGFVVPSLAIPRGTSIDVVGADTTAHNLACAKKTRRKPRRPLCSSGFVALGETARVVGVEKLKPGTYGLLCQLHPKMTVELTVLATP